MAWTTSPALAPFAYWTPFAFGRPLMVKSVQPFFMLLLLLLKNGWVELFMIGVFVYPVDIRIVVENEGSPLEGRGVSTAHP